MLHWPFALHGSCLLQKAVCWCALLSTGEAPVIVHYFITLQPAATGCETCFSLLICSARYSFSALLHLIRTSCVPPNNGIMAGTHWLCWCWVPSGQAPEPWSGNLSLHKCGTVTSARVCWCLLVSTSHPHHGVWRGFRLPGVLIVKYFTQFIAHEDLRRKIFVVAHLSHRNKVLGPGLQLLVGCNLFVCT